MASASEPDPYTVLGVARNATDAEIRAAYRELGAKYHPDRHQGNPLEGLASARMAEINRAYEVLSDPKRRAAYDAHGIGGARAGGGGFGPSDGGAGAGGDAAADPFARAGFAQPPFGGKRGKRLIGLVLLLPVLIRFGGLIVRGIAVALREIIEGFAALRGTPAVGAVVVLAVVALVGLWWRRRARKRTPANGGGSPR